MLVSRSRRHSSFKATARKGRQHSLDQLYFRVSDFRRSDTLLTADYAETDEARDAARVAVDSHMAGVGGGLLDAPDFEGRHPTLPGWFQQARRDAWAQFEGMQMPARTEQAWRFASLGKISLDHYTPPQGVDEATRERLIGRSQGNEKVAGRMVFANDTLLDRRTHAPELAAQGVVWKPLDAALGRAPGAFPEAFHGAGSHVWVRRNSPRCIVRVCGRGHSCTCRKTSRSRCPWRCSTG